MKEVLPVKTRVISRLRAFVFFSLICLCNAVEDRCWRGNDPFLYTQS